jgi:hypothetical protein
MARWGDGYEGYKKPGAGRVFGVAKRCVAELLKQSEY